MSTFRTADELATRFLVNEACLQAYARRGNLSMRRRAGVEQFDEEAVARLFQRRGVAASEPSEPSEPMPERGPRRPCYGILGACRLGVGAT